MSSTVIQDLDDLQQSVDQWHQRTSGDLQAMHTKFTSQIRSLEEAINGGGVAPSSRPTPAGGNGNFNANKAPAAAGGANNASSAGGMDWEQLLTPQRQGGSNRPTPSGTPSMASPPVSHALNYDLLIDEAKGTKSENTKPLSEAEEAALRTRPSPSNLNSRELPTAAPAPHDREQPCQVLVEFKRKRILQFESPQYVAPGEYVVVCGDRGEDIGLVTHTWPAGAGPAPGSGKWADGMGKVTRLATPLEVNQLQGVQTELEMRAVEVAQEKVVEHQLPMRIVDAEYQFDRKKLTFYYQSQHRLDFRNLVRDLYKTFRARIWMELD